MRKSTKTIVLSLLAAVLIIAALVLWLNWGRWFGGAPTLVPAATATPRPQLSIDPGAGVRITATPRPAEGGGISIPGWGSITLPAGQTDVTVDFPNPEANADKYYLSFALRLKESGEVLYTSGLVPPGLTIQHITLSRPLEEGRYKAVVHVQPYKMDEAQTPTNNADMETELIVVNPQ